MIILKNFFCDFICNWRDEFLDTVKSNNERTSLEY